MSDTRTNVPTSLFQHVIRGVRNHVPETTPPAISKESAEVLQDTNNTMEKAAVLDEGSSLDSALMFTVPDNEFQSKFAVDDVFVSRVSGKKMIVNSIDVLQPDGTVKEVRGVREYRGRRRAKNEDEAKRIHDRIASDAKASRTLAQSAARQYSAEIKQQKRRTRQRFVYQPDYNNALEVWRAKMRNVIAEERAELQRVKSKWSTIKKATTAGIDAIKASSEDYRYKSEDTKTRRALKSTITRINTLKQKGYLDKVDEMEVRLKGQINAVDAKLKAHQDVMHGLKGTTSLLQDAVKAYTAAGGPPEIGYERERDTAKVSSLK